MAEKDSLDDRKSLFVGSAEQLQALETWIDEFTRAVASRCDDRDGQESYTVDLGALNKVLSTGGDYLGCLNPVDAEECLRLIRELQKEVTTLLAGGLAGLVDLSGERTRAYEQCQGILKLAVPHFHRLGVRIRDEIRLAGRTDPGGSNLIERLPAEPDTPTEPANAPSTAKKPKRSTVKGEAREKLIAALTKHHKYADGGCLNLEPIGNNELARQAKVDRATASAFFKKEFEGHTKYRALCGDATGLVAAIKLLNQEFSPHHLFGGCPPGEVGESDK